MGIIKWRFCAGLSTRIWTPLQHLKVPSACNWNVTHVLLIPILCARRPTMLYNMKQCSGGGQKRFWEWDGLSTATSSYKILARNKWRKHLKHTKSLQVSRTQKRDPSIPSQSPFCVHAYPRPIQTIHKLNFKVTGPHYESSYSNVGMWL